MSKPLITCVAAGIFSRKMLSGQGLITVTPVLSLSVTIVLWPTVTPATSVIKFFGPGLVSLSANKSGLLSPIFTPFVF